MSPVKVTPPPPSASDPLSDVRRLFSMFACSTVFVPPIAAVPLTVPVHATAASCPCSLPSSATVTPDSASPAVWNSERLPATLHSGRSAFSGVYVATCTTVAVKAGSVESLSAPAKPSDPTPVITPSATLSDTVPLTAPTLTAPCTSNAVTPDDPSNVTTAAAVVLPPSATPPRTVPPHTVAPCDDCSATLTSSTATPDTVTVSCVDTSSVHSAVVPSAPHPSCCASVPVTVTPATVAVTVPAFCAVHPSATYCTCPAITTPACATSTASDTPSSAESLKSAVACVVTPPSALETVAVSDPPHCSAPPTYVPETSAPSPWSASPRTPTSPVATAPRRSTSAPSCPIAYPHTSRAADVTCSSASTPGSATDGDPLSALNLHDVAAAAMRDSSKNGSPASVYDRRDGRSSVSSSPRSAMSAYSVVPTAPPASFATVNPIVTPVPDPPPIRPPASSPDHDTVRPAPPAPACTSSVTSSSVPSSATLSSRCCTVACAATFSVAVPPVHVAVASTDPTLTIAGIPSARPVPSHALSDSIPVAMLVVPLRHWSIPVASALSPVRHTSTPPVAHPIAVSGEAALAAQAARSSKELIFVCLLSMKYRYCSFY
eukprot:Rhum_TRINITY_DN22868_c0_g1::Rhum_TRINITY_DN22868_c0_g1_i1::g.176392::m.176392